MIKDSFSVCVTAYKRLALWVTWSSKPQWHSNKHVTCTDSWHPSYPLWKGIRSTLKPPTGLEPKRCWADRALCSARPNDGQRRQEFDPVSASIRVLQGSKAFGENPLGSAGRKREFSYGSGCFCLSCQGLVLKENQVNLLLWCIAIAHDLVLCKLL